MKRFLASMLAALLLFAFVPMGLRADAASASAEGEYKLFTTEYMGRQVAPEVWGISYTVTLNKDGTGTIEMLGMDVKTKITKWTEKNGTVALTLEGDVEMRGAYDKGILELEMGEGTYYYFARKDADTKDFKTSGHPTGSLLYKAFSAIDQDKGAHLRYSYHSDYLDSSSSFDSHAKGSDIIIMRITKAKGYEQMTASMTKDGTVYQLYPSEKKGSVLIASMPSFSLLSVMQQDELYRAMATRAMRTDYKVEQREVDGVKYQVEVYPAQDYYAEAAFYFDKDGQLVHVLEGAPVSMPSMGETFYTVTAIDDKVNESLFDISTYKIDK